RSIHDMGCDIVSKGVTTLEEIERVLGTGSSVAATVASPGGSASGRATQPATTSTAPDTSPPAPVPAPVVQPRVLIADDDLVNRKVVRGTLTRCDFLVEECVDGEQAIKTLGADPGYHLLLLDLDMPKVGGREVLRWARQNPA